MKNEIKILKTQESNIIEPLLQQNAMYWTVDQSKRNGRSGTNYNYNKRRKSNKVKEINKLRTSFDY